MQLTGQCRGYGMGGLTQDPDPQSHSLLQREPTKATQAASSVTDN